MNCLRSVDEASDIHLFTHAASGRHLSMLSDATGLTATAVYMDGEKNAYCLKVGFNAGHARH